jgi:hypothetical protein
VALFAGHYPTWFGARGQRRQHIADIVERVKVHSRALAPLSTSGRAVYLADMLRRNTARRQDVVAAAPPDPVLVYRKQVEDATMSGILRYTPRYFPGRIHVGAIAEMFRKSLENP